MELCSSPYNVIQGVLVTTRFVLGDLDNSTNAFQWSSILENPPCLSTYNASKVKLKKWRFDGMTASEIAIYVDDLRLIAGSHVAKGLSWLGPQDAAQKRHMGSQRLGA